MAVMEGPIPGSEQNPPPPPETLTGTKKRKLGTDHQNLHKIRSIVKALRPSFVEVLHAPDFRNCKAAQEIREQMKIMIDLSRQLRTEAEEGSTKLPEKPKEEPAEQPQSLTDSMRPPVEQPIHTPQFEEVSEKSQVKNQEEQREEDSIQGTFIVGGSPLGWNYLFFPNDHLVYCGETKEIFRQRQVTK